MKDSATSPLDPGHKQRPEASSSRALGPEVMCSGGGGSPGREEGPASLVGSEDISGPNWPWDAGLNGQREHVRFLKVPFYFLWDRLLPASRICIEVIDIYIVSEEAS